MKKAGISGLEIVIKIRQSFTSRKVALSDWHIRFKANKNYWETAWIKPFLQEGSVRKASLYYLKSYVGYYVLCG
ncbi:hypothetical protein [Mucilaginibacter sp.]|uniref:hypothetical protein n=1 Tax=Mucilaginibacter sp. TaxID=1882438 RepID=UPI002ED32149